MVCFYFKRRLNAPQKQNGLTKQKESRYLLKLFQVILNKNVAPAMPNVHVCNLPDSHLSQFNPK